MTLLPDPAFVPAHAELGHVRYSKNDASAWAKSDKVPKKLVTTLEEAGPGEGRWPDQVTLKEALESVERSLLLEGRERYGNQTRMAAALGINQSTIARKLKRYGIA